jgi:dTDP-D-glucose 4,6-dehydratase
MFKFIDIRIFLISLSIGLFYIYIAEDYKKVIVMYPTPDNIKNTQYKDKTGNCFSYNLKEIKCPLDEKLIYNIIRFFNVYGPRQKPIFVVSRAISRALRDLPVEMFDGGEQTRSYIYISDAVEAMIAIQENKSTEKIFNIGSTNEISVQELYTKIKSILTNMSIKDTSTKLSHGVGYEDLLRRVPDNTRLINNTQWRPDTSIESGIEKTIKWARENKWWLDLESDNKL